MSCSTIRLIFILLLQLMAVLCIGVESVLVKVEQGWLKGDIKMTSTNMEKYCSFKGIPYAAPPLGKLRFKAPQPPLKWEGVRNATEHGDICMQPTTYANRTAIGSEDCLFLNIYTPNINPDCLLPVMFFIPGGLYTIGSGNSDKYDPGFLMSYNVVLVTVNYRLGALGFLAVDTEEVPGNAGMKDTIAALQWVQKNIKSFGGDPDFVTLFGQSSGAAMVSLHVVAPSAKNLFKRAIIMSATFMCDWSIEYEPRRKAFALGRVLGLNSNDSDELIDFLQNISPEKLIEARPNFLPSDEITTDLIIAPYYTTNIERKFGNGKGQYLTMCPAVLMCNNQTNQVDLIIGHTANEGLQYTADSKDLILKYYPYYKELLVPLKIRYYRSPSTVLKLADRVNSFYFKNQTINNNTQQYLLNFDEYIKHFRFVFDIHVYIERLHKFLCVRRYFYEFAIYSTRNYYSQLGAKMYGIKEATHGDDIPYVFDGSFFNFNLDVNSKAFKYVQLMCKLFTNFAKFGNPTPDDSLGLIWPEYDPTRAYVSIGRNDTLLTPAIVPAFTDPHLKFWRELYLSAGIQTY